jgi:hypothetical protein
MVTYAQLFPDLAPLWDSHAEGWRVADKGELAVWVVPMMFTVAIIVGEPGQGWYEDRWCYQDARQALLAAAAWTGPWPGSEPTGWHRHPGSGRRRPGGDQAREYVAP